MGKKEYVERRKHRRYIVRGRVMFTMNSLDLWGDLINFGYGGMLVRARYEIPENSKLEFRVVAYCYPEMFSVPGQVVGGRESLLAIKFLERTDRAMDLLRWLEVENCPWTGGSGAKTEELPRSWQTLDSHSAQLAGGIQAESTLESIFQDA